MGSHTQLLFRNHNLLHCSEMILRAFGQQLDVTMSDWGKCNDPNHNPVLDHHLLGHADVGPPELGDEAGSPSAPPGGSPRKAP